MNNCPKCGAEMVSRICPLCGFYVSPSSDKNAENTGAQNGGGAAVGYTGSSMFKDCGRKASANGSNASGSSTNGSNASGANKKRRCPKCGREVTSRFLP